MTTWEEWAKNVEERLKAINDRIDYLAKSMAWSTQISARVEEHNALRDELVEKFFLNPMTESIIELLKSGEYTERQLYRLVENPQRHPLNYHAFLKAWENLQKSKAVVSTAHGRGKARTWKLNEGEKS